MTSWQTPPHRVAIAPGELHLWRASLDVGPAQRERLAESLDAHERLRAARLRSVEDGERFRARRGVLRALLSRYVGAPPAALCFRDGARGKPELAGAALQFNLAHSGALALYAVSFAAVGVDVERVRRRFDWRPIVRRFFSPAERGAIDDVAQFFACWTRKEAYLKARGDGLLRPLDEPVDDGWWMREIQPAPGYAAAVAGAGDPPRVMCWRWTG